MGMLSALSNPLTMNPIAQRVLAQSVNLSYAGRGAYRVSDTQPERKGDYWFRDFGMVMACTYMTELAFRGTERLYTMPLLTNALELNSLRSNGHGQKRAVPFVDDKGIQRMRSAQLYPHALNYSEMPDALRQRMMGTLIRNSSDLVPQVLEKDSLEAIDRAVKAGEIKKDIAPTLKEILQNPLNPDNDATISKLLNKWGLAGDDTLKKLNALVRIDNKQAQAAAITKAGLNNEHAYDAVRLLGARQTGYLINHLDRTLNFQHYLENNYLKPKGEAFPHGFEMPVALRRQNIYSPVSELGEMVSEKLNFYVDKLHGLQSSAKGELKKLAYEVRKQPLDKRAEKFNALIGKVDNFQQLYKRESFIDFFNTPGATDEEKKELQDLYKQIASYDKKNITSSLKPKGSWENWQADYYQKRANLEKFLLSDKKLSQKALDKQLQDFDGFFEQMSTKPGIKQWQTQKLWNHLGVDLLIQIKKKIKDAALDINKLAELPKGCKSKEELMKARLIDLGLGDDPKYGGTGWLSEDKLKDLSKALVAPFKNQVWERSANEDAMDKVKKEIFGHLTAYRKENGVNSSKGALFELLSGEGQNQGLEALLKPILNEKNLHQVDGKPSVEWTVKSLIFDGMKSKTVKSAVDKIQRNGTWPKMAATVALNFIFYGWLASRFDNKVLQPYEEKLVARKGTSQDIVNAGYLGTLPGLAVLSQLFDRSALPIFRQMNHFTRFASVGGVALATFAGSTYGFLRLLDKKTPAQPTSAQQGKPQNTTANSPFNASSHPFKPAQPTFGNPANRSFSTSQPFQSYRSFAPQPFNRPAQIAYTRQYPHFQANEKIEA